MKTWIACILVVILILSSSATLVDNWYNFYINKEKHQLYFQKVYNTDITKDSLITRLNLIGTVSDIETHQNGSITMLYADNVRYRHLGLKKYKTPYIYSDSEVNGTVKIQFKPGRYRVTIDKMYFKWLRTLQGFTVKDEKYTFEQFFLNGQKSKFKGTKRYLQTISSSIDSTYSPAAALPASHADDW